MLCCMATRGCHLRHLYSPDNSANLPTLPGPPGFFLRAACRHGPLSGGCPGGVRDFIGTGLDLLWRLTPPTFSFYHVSCTVDLRCEFFPQRVLALQGTVPASGPQKEAWRNRQGWQNWQAKTAITSRHTAPYNTARDQVAIQNGARRLKRK